MTHCNCNLYSLFFINQTISSQCDIKKKSKKKKKAVALLSLGECMMKWAVIYSKKGMFIIMTLFTKQSWITLEMYNNVDMIMQGTYVNSRLHSTNYLVHYFCIEIHWTMKETMGPEGLEYQRCMSLHSPQFEHST